MTVDPNVWGLRDEDLTEAERVARDRALADDADARAERRADDVLARRLRAVPLPAARPTPAVPAASSPPRWTAVGAVALAAVTLVVVGRGDVLRARGAGGSALAEPVVLRAVAERPGGQVRALADGDSVRTDERVVFDVQTPAAGTVVLTEAGRPVWPAGGTWQVDAGRHLVGGDRPQAWRPDHGVSGAQRYVARWCDADGACTDAALDLTWDAR
ncbi:MAG: hypothetical protein H6733_03120 [Alphaproteobacteria bacterium]|nr:hypothetical protein [Alphaproteobacteria bacterium]